MLPLAYLDPDRGSGISMGMVILIAVLALILATIVVEETIRWRRRRVPVRSCPRCGWDVRAGTLDCPHCSFDFRTIGA